MTWENDKIAPPKVSVHAETAAGVFPADLPLDVCAPDFYQNLNFWLGGQFYFTGQTENG
jgi:hypothetical protein